MKLIELIKNTQKKKILVIGDIMLDNYYFGKSTRISPEAPVPILLEKNNKKVPGGASNVALNLASGNQNVSLVSVIGDDNSGKELLNILEEKGINTSLVLKDETRPTIVKNRFIGQNNMQMFRFDQEDNSLISSELSFELCNTVKKNIKDFDLLIISDYNKGLLNEENTQKIIEIANKNNIKVLIDIKEPNYNKYKNAYVIKPNLEELKMITKMSVDTEKEILEACIELKNNTNCNYVLVTRGKDGMSLYDGSKLTNIECMSQEVYDVTGAGDTVISYFGIGVANNFDLLDSAYIASYAAGVKVSKMGTYAVKPEDIIDYIIDSNNVLDENKVVSIYELEEILKKNTKK